MGWLREERFELEWEDESEVERTLRLRRLSRIDRLVGLVEDFTYLFGTGHYPDAELLDAAIALGVGIPGFALLGGGELLDALFSLEQRLLRRRRSDQLSLPALHDIAAWTRSRSMPEELKAELHQRTRENRDAALRTREQRHEALSRGTSEAEVAQAV